MARGDYFSGGGKLYFSERQSDGSDGALLYFGRTSGITLSSSIEYKDAYNSEGITQLLGNRLPAKTDVSATFTTDQVDVKSLSIAFKGAEIDVTQAAVTDEPSVVYSVTAGGYVDLGVYNITSMIVMDDTDTTTYAEGTDYNINKNSGLLEIIDGGTILTGDDLHLTTTYPEYIYTGVAGFKKSVLEGKFVVITETDTVNNYKVIVKRMSVSMDGDFNLKNPDEFTTIPFTGAAMIDTTTVSNEWSDYVDFIPIEPSA